MNMEQITAAQARQLTEDAKNIFSPEVEIYLARAFEEIKAAAAKEQRSVSIDIDCWSPDRVADQVRRRLIELGYNARIDSYRNESYLSINWNE